jgi:hypothetical protein
VLVKIFDEEERLRPEDTDKAEIVGSAELGSKAEEVGGPLLVCLFVGTPGSTVAMVGARSPEASLGRFLHMTAAPGSEN